MSYDYDRRPAAGEPQKAVRRAVDLGAGVERFQRLVDEIRKNVREAKKLAVQGTKSKDRVKADDWRDSIEGLDRIIDELDGM